MKEFSPWRRIWCIYMRGSLDCASVFHFRVFSNPLPSILIQATSLQEVLNAPLCWPFSSWYCHCIATVLSRFCHYVSTVLPRYCCTVGDCSTAIMLAWKQTISFTLIRTTIHWYDQRKNFLRLVSISFLCIKKTTKHFDLNKSGAS